MRFKKGDRVIDKLDRRGATVAEDSDGPDVLVVTDQGASVSVKAEDLEWGFPLSGDRD